MSAVVVGRAGGVSLGGRDVVVVRGSLVGRVGNVDLGPCNVALSFLVGIVVMGSRGGAVGFVRSGTCSVDRAGAVALGSNAALVRFGNFVVIGRVFVVRVSASKRRDQELKMCNR